MKNVQKSMQKVLLLASVASVAATQVIFASQISSETALADNERERERERESNSRAIWASGF